MGGDFPSFFHGVSAEEVGRVINRLRHRNFHCGSTVIAEGDERCEIYIIQSGTAGVFLTDGCGVEHTVNQVGPGATLGEMSFFTGQPATATVRAITDLDVVVLDEAEFDHVVAAFPRLYYNLGAILSQRLALVNRRSLRAGPGNVTVLLDYSSPPLLSYALACSLAWHTRGSTLLLIVSNGSPSPELAALAANEGSRHSSFDRANGPLFPGRMVPAKPRAHLRVVSPTNAFAPEILTDTLHDLCVGYDYVLIQVAGEGSRLRIPGRSLRLCGEETQSKDLPTSGANDQAGCTVRGWKDSKPGRPDMEGVVSVPALDPADEQAVSQGVLPAVTPAGKALGWVARDLADLKVGLALGAGVAKGYAHIGVLNVLESAGITVDYIAGTSIGAGVAMLHALGHRPDQTAQLMDKVGAVAFRLTLPFRSLLSIDGIRKGLRQITGEACFEDLRLPLAVVAADIATGREVVFQRGLLWPPVLASMAIPGLYPPQQIGAHTLVDGGVVNPVPSNVTAVMGADIVIAVKLARRSGPLAVENEAQQATNRSQSVLQTLLRSFEMMQSKIITEAAAKATILIEPVFGTSSNYGLRSFMEGRSYIELGEAAALAALPRIAAALPWLR